MLRLTIVVATSAAVVLGLILNRYAAVGLIAGVAVGAFYFFAALATGRGMIDVRMVKNSSGSRDPSTAISMGLGAAGIACSAYANPHYPRDFHLFYLVCAIVGLIIAVAAAFKQRGNDRAFDPGAGNPSDQPGGDNDLR